MIIDYKREESRSIAGTTARCILASLKCRRGTTFASSPMFPKK